MPVTISGTTGIQTPGVANSGTSTATLFSGPLTGNVTGNASTATLATSASTAVVATSAVPSSNLGLATCKAWVNFNGRIINPNYVVPTALTMSTVAGSNIGNFSQTGGVIDTDHVGCIHRIIQIGGVSNALFGGVDVSTLGIQILTVVSTGGSNFTGTFRLLSGPAISSQTITGTGSSSSGFSFNITGIRSAYNVSSVTRNGTGDYTINFTTPMADAFYSVSGIGRNNHGGSTDPNSGYGSSICLSRTTAPTTSAVRIWVIGLVATATAVNIVSPQDQETTSIQVFGN